ALEVMFDGARRQMYNTLNLSTQQWSYKEIVTERKDYTCDVVRLGFDQLAIIAKSSKSEEKKKEILNIWQVVRKIETAYTISCNEQRALFDAARLIVAYWFEDPVSPLMERRLLTIKSHRFEHKEKDQGLPFVGADENSDDGFRLKDKVLTISRYATP